MSRTEFAGRVVTVHVRYSCSPLRGRAIKHAGPLVSSSQIKSVESAREQGVTCGRKPHTIFLLAAAIRRVASTPRSTSSVNSLAALSTSLMRRTHTAYHAESAITSMMVSALMPARAVPEVTASPTPAWPSVGAAGRSSGPESTRGPRDPGTSAALPGTTG